jgi:uncharacterized membrane-anchored protein
VQELGIPCMIFLPHGVDVQMQAFLHTIGVNIAIARQFYLKTLCTTKVAVQTPLKN